MTTFQPPNYPPIDREVPIALSSFAVFSDDIRAEDNGKLMLIGVYMDDMFVPKFPHLHPGLAISVLVSAEKQDMPESIGVKVYINEKLLMEIPTEFTSKMHATPTSGTPIEGLPNVTRIRTFFRTPPLLIDAPSALRVRVSAGDVVLRTAVLNISQAPES